MATTKKKPGTPAKRKTTKKASVKKACRKLVTPTGVKADGTLKPGYKYLKGGRVVKAKAKTASKRKTTKK